MRSPIFDFILVHSRTVSRVSEMTTSVEIIPANARAMGTSSVFMGTNIEEGGIEGTVTVESVDGAICSK